MGKMKIWLNKCRFLKDQEREKILKTVKKILKDKKRDGEISITFVDNKTIRKLNKRYRGKDLPTDVLSFELNNSEFIIGDIYISEEIARIQAKDNGYSLFDEIFLLVIHGVLHLLGYDHNTMKESRKMRKEEEKYMGGWVDVQRAKSIG